jgi:hypothetical protein
MRVFVDQDADARHGGFRFDAVLGERTRRWALSVREYCEQEMLGTNVLVTLPSRPRPSLIKNLLLAR